jgi:hypothetical protein
MLRHEWLPRLGVALGYVLVALAFTWPLPLHLGSRLTGDPHGDTGVYVWNQWVFQHEIDAGANPLSTRQILSLSPRVDLSQHNYTVLLDLLAVPLIPAIGVVAAFNVVLLIVTVLTALAAYALARQAFRCTRVEAFAAGLAFAWSPVLVARTTGHFSLVAGAPLAAFAWCLFEADRRRSVRFAAWAGVAMALAGYCDPYLAVFCLLLAGTYVASRLLSVTRRTGPRREPWVRALDVVLVAAAGAVLWVAAGGGQVNVAGIAFSARGLYTPVLILTVLATLRVALLFRAELVGLDQWPWFLRLAATAGLACGVLLSPVLYGLVRLVAEGEFVRPPVLWRSSSRGVDLLAFLVPNPSHPLWRWMASDGRSVGPEVSAEYTAALSLVALAAIGIAVIVGRFRPKRHWWWITVGFAVLALGPFVIAGGVNTHVPGPWALLRYVPVINFVRTPTRFAIVTTLGVATLLAGALAALGGRWPHRRRGIAWAALALLIVELLPAPRRLYPAEHSPLSDIIAADQRPVRVLNLPLGVEDGMSPPPNLVAGYQFEQTRHGKAIPDGYLSRISPRRLSGMVQRFPLVGALIAMSDGQVLSEEEAARFVAEGRTFLAETNIGYVVIHRPYVTPQLEALAIAAFRLEAVASDGPVTLYRPADLR